MNSMTFALDELCGLTGYSKRAVRYYIQVGLVSRPVGETRGAKYFEEHLSQLLRIKELTASGLSLGSIHEVLWGVEPPVPTRRLRPGTVEVRSHIYAAPGIEIQIVPEEAGLSPEHLRTFVKQVMRVAEQMPNMKESGR